MANTLANEAHQRSLKDFLTLYNTITEFCFKRCISNFNERCASGNETSCVDVCTDNYVQYNQRFMFNFVDHQERRKKDTELAAAEAAAKEAASAQEAQAAQLKAAQEAMEKELPAFRNVPVEQLTAAQEAQMQQAAQMLEHASASSSAGSTKALISDLSDPAVLQNLPGLNQVEGHVPPEFSVPGSSQLPPSAQSSGV